MTEDVTVEGLYSLGHQRQALGKSKVHGPYGLRVCFAGFWRLEVPTGCLSLALLP